MSIDIILSTKALHLPTAPATLLGMGTRDSNHLGRFLLDLRRAKKLTQVELSQQIGLEATVSISRWENGVDPVPPRHYRSLAHALNTTVERIIALAEHDHPGSEADYHRLAKQLGHEVPLKIDPTIGLHSLPRHLADWLKALAGQYRLATPQVLLESAVEHFLTLAHQGHTLDANGRLTPATLARSHHADPTGGMPTKRAARTSQH